MVISRLFFFFLAACSILIKPKVCCLLGTPQSPRCFAEHQNSDLETCVTFGFWITVLEIIEELGSGNILCVMWWMSFIAWREAWRWKPFSLVGYIRHFLPLAGIFSSLPDITDLGKEHGFSSQTDLSLNLSPANSIAKGYWKDDLFVSFSQKWELECSPNSSSGESLERTIWHCKHSVEVSSIFLLPLL